MATYDDATMYQPNIEGNNQFGGNMPPVPPVPFQGEPEQKSSNAAQTIALAGAAGVVLGAAAGGGVAYAMTPGENDDENLIADVGNLANNVEIDDAHVQISGEMTCSDSLTFSQAFAQARAQLGPGGVFHWHGGVYGTYYANEWDAMSPEEQHDFTAQAMHQDVHTTVHHTAVVNNNVVVDTDAGVATGVDDDMSFSEAFAEARAELGPGGVFEWHGRLYNTYYANEWNAMTPEQRGGFELAVRDGGGVTTGPVGGDTAQWEREQGDFDQPVVTRGNVSIDNDDDDGGGNLVDSGSNNIDGNDGGAIGIDTTLEYEAPDTSFDDDNLHLTSADVDSSNGMSDYMNEVYDA